MPSLLKTAKSADSWLPSAQRRKIQTLDQCFLSAGTEDPIVSGCGFRVAREGGGRFIEPPDAVKGQIARIYFYFEGRYSHRIAGSQRRVFDAWNKQFPPDASEIERDQRLAAITGVSNPFVVLY